VGLLGVYTTESALFNATEVEPIPLNSGFMLAVGADSWRDIAARPKCWCEIAPTPGETGRFAPTLGVSVGRTGPIGVRARRVHGR